MCRIKYHAETSNLQYAQDQRKRPPEKQKDELDEEEDEQKMREESGLVRTGRFFGGLINDIKRKAPW
jgi:sodium bicarbonate transporter 10